MSPAKKDDKRFRIGNDRQPTVREKLKAHIGQRKKELQNLKQYQKPPAPKVDTGKGGK